MSPRRFAVARVRHQEHAPSLGLWLVGWGLVFAQMKQVFVMLHPPAAEARRVEAAARGKDPVSLGVDPDTAAPFTPYRLRV
jgi:hypothetical protein